MTDVQVAVPVCPTCSVPFALRCKIRLSTGREWIYQRDCKHKTKVEDVKIEGTALLVVPDTTAEVEGD